MDRNYKGLFYIIFIDPLLAGLKHAVAERIPEGSTIIDIACGTGSLAVTLAPKAKYITAIDLDPDLIKYASEEAAKRKVRNINFLVKDASSLSDYSDKQFDVAVTSMAVHQFNEQLAIQILREMKRIARKIIIADYNCPMPCGFSRSLAYLIESLAKGDHYRNFRNYMSKGGLKYFADAAELKIESQSVKGNGIFIVAEYV